MQEKCDPKHLPRGLIFFGAVLGLTAVLAGTFAAHVLKSQWHDDPGRLEVFETAVRYQMYHALAAILAGLLASVTTHPGNLRASGGTEPKRCARQGGFTWAGGFFLIGTLLFSGSLYALVLTGVKKLGLITPVGGVCFLIGWCMLALAAFTSRGSATTAASDISPKL